MNDNDNNYGISSTAIKSTKEKLHRVIFGAGKIDDFVKYLFTEYRKE